MKNLRSSVVVPMQPVRSGNPQHLRCAGLTRTHGGTSSTFPHRAGSGTHSDPAVFAFEMAEPAFNFAFWARFDQNGNEVQGGCVHPVTSGNAGFTGARGLLTMRDFHDALPHGVACMSMIGMHPIERLRAGGLQPGGVHLWPFHLASRLRLGRSAV